MAVTASTLTTVAVFFPLVFVQGVAGQLFRDQALTITFAMLISLVVAMTLIPMLASLKGRAPLAYRDEPARAPRPLPNEPLCAAVVRSCTRAIRRGSCSRSLPRALAWLIAVGARLPRHSRSDGSLRFVGRGVTAPYDAPPRSITVRCRRRWRIRGACSASPPLRWSRSLAAGADARPRPDSAARAGPLRHDGDAAARHAAGRHRQARRRNLRAAREGSRRRLDLRRHRHRHAPRREPDRIGREHRAPARSR